MRVKIRYTYLEIPLIPGGMGVGISLGGLAGAVAAEGGMGTVSAAGVGFRESDFDKDMAAANVRALKKEIAIAKEKSGGRGLVAVNIMTAMNNFEDSSRAAVEGGADAKKPAGVHKRHRRPHSPCRFKRQSGKGHSAPVGPPLRRSP